jgi:ATP-dependent Clp protease ATP-binding subunit ClpA
MIDKLTDRSRRTLGHAQALAARLNCEYIGTEHLLYGLSRDEHSVASHALKKFKVTEKEIYAEIKRLTDSLSASNLALALPFTPRLDKSLRYADQEAKELNHNFIGTEHLLLGLFKVPEGTAILILNNLKVDLKQLRKFILELLGSALEEEIPDLDQTTNSVWLDTLAQFQKDGVEVELTVAIGSNYERMSGTLKEFDQESIVLKHEQSKEILVPYCSTILINRINILSIECELPSAE